MPSLYEHHPDSAIGNARGDLIERMAAVVQKKKKFCKTVFNPLPHPPSSKMSDRLTRIAIVSSDKCKPKKCRQEW
jgi:hypothetical protein